MSALPDHFNVITTREQLREFQNRYLSVPEFFWDVETIGEDRIDPKINDICWISFADGRTVDIIPMGHPNGEFVRWEKPLLAEGKRRLLANDPKKPVLESHYSKSEKSWTPIFDAPPTQLNPGEVMSAIEPIMFGRALKGAHNAKFDNKSIAKYFARAPFRWRVPAGPHFDTMVAAFIIDSRNKFNLNLQACVARELGVYLQKGVGENVALHSFYDVALYSGLDSEVGFRLMKSYQAKLQGSLRKVWKLETDLVPALCDMELEGAPMDTNVLGELSDRITKDREVAEGHVYRVAGKAFSINSTPAKQELLFGSVDGKRPRVVPKLKSKVTLTPKGLEVHKRGGDLLPAHYSTSAEALEFFRGKDALVDALLAYQDLNKLLSTYVTPYTGGMIKRVTNGKERFVEKKSLLLNGRAHTNFKSTGAETGRFSSSNPNLQNIPNSRTEYGKLVRNLFVAPSDDHELIVADYSQIEPRIIAALSGDERLVQNYLTGGDVYTTIASPLGQPRNVGKVLVLSVSYGVGPDKVAVEAGCSLQEAKNLMNGFNEEFPGINRLKAKVIRMARQQAPIPYVETIFGRRRYLPDLRLRDSQENRGLIGRAERQAFNTVIQGTAADVMKLAIIRAHSCFTDEPDINVILTVHDELVTITPKDRSEEVSEAIRASMEGIRIKEITVPLKAEVYAVDKWGEAK